MAVATTAMMARIGNMHMIVDRYSGHFKVNLCYNRSLARASEDENEHYTRHNYPDEES